jgi:antitoxin component YwqK of YwqJK toxin-antitoxin module
MLKYIGDWANGQETGELREYYADGSLKSNKYFNNGKIKPAETRNHVQGKEFDGNEKKHFGKPKPKSLAKGTLVDGFNRIMNADGTVSKEGEFKNKKLVDGKQFIYENGKVVKAIIYANGRKSGEETVD